MQTPHATAPMEHGHCGLGGANQGSGGVLPVPIWDQHATAPMEHGHCGLGSANQGSGGVLPVPTWDQQASQHAAAPIMDHGLGPRHRGLEGANQGLVGCCRFQPGISRHLSILQPP